MQIILLFLNKWYSNIINKKLIAHFMTLLLTFHEFDHISFSHFTLKFNFYTFYHMNFLFTYFTIAFFETHLAICFGNKIHCFVKK